MKILIVEDDRTIHFGLKSHLSKSYEVISAYTKSEAERLIDGSIDLYLLDVTLPDGTGIELLKLIRKEYDTPALFLSAHDDETTIDEGFKTGGDDYITKPFRLSDLDNRIASIQRRSNIKRVGNISVDVNRAKVTIDDEMVVLSVIEYQLLLELIHQSPNVVGKEHLIEKVWGEASDNTLSVNMRRLRTKIGDGAEIKSIQNQGY